MILDNENIKWRWLVKGIVFVILLNNYFIGTILYHAQ